MNYLQQHNEVLTWHVKLAWLIPLGNLYCTGKGILQEIKEAPLQFSNKSTLENLDSFIKCRYGKEAPKGEVAIHRTDKPLIIKDQKFF